MTYEQPSLKALTIVLILSNRRLSHSSSPSTSFDSSPAFLTSSTLPIAPAFGAVTELMTRNVVRSNKTTSAAEVTSRNCERWVRREESDGMR